MIKLVLSGGNQTITKVCNDCGCHLDNLTVEDIMVKKPSDLTIKDKDGNEITRTSLPNSLKVCQCEDCQ
jgi:hypothetical protein|tara:strand:- start:1375 stop:1581 length:207 start_codon:yes stop_codon:yes gene_type:complete